MKSFLTLCLVGSASLFSGGIASAGETVEIPFGTPLIVDGNLEDPCWRTAYRTGGFRPLHAGTELKHPTEAMFCRDGENLYVAFVCKAGGAEAVRRAVAACRPGRVYGGDHVEMFLDPGESGSLAQIGIDVSGQFSFPDSFKPIKYGVQYVSDGWHCEVQIPYDAVRIKGDALRTDWMFNVARSIPEGDRCVSATWSALARGTFHDEAAFNRVRMPDVDLKAIRAVQTAADRSDFEITTDRIVYTDLRRIAVKLDVACRRSMKGFSIVAKLLDAQGAIVAEKSVSPVCFTTEFELPVADLANGRYRLELALRDKEGRVLREGSVNVWKIPPVDLSRRKTRWEIRNQVFYRNGKPFFPIYTWAVGWNEAVIRDMREHGFNMAVCTGDSFPDEDFERICRVGKLQPWLRKPFRANKDRGLVFADMAAIFEKHGLMMQAWPPYLNGFATEDIDALVDFMVRMRDYDVISCWRIADETDGDIRGNALRNRLCHEIDPSRKTVLCTINGVVANCDNADIHISDPYPFRYGHPANISMISANADRLARTVTNPDQSYMLIVQLFGDGKPGKGYRPAKPHEVRAEAFLALNHGVKGLGWFTYQPPEKRTEARQDPASWEELAKIHAEIQSLAEVFLLGEPLTRGEQGPLDVSAYRHGGKVYVSIVNTKDMPVTDCIVKIPGLGDRKYSFGPYGQSVEVWR